MQYRNFTLIRLYSNDKDYVDIFVESNFAPEGVRPKVIKAIEEIKAKGLEVNEANLINILKHSTFKLADFHSEIIHYNDRILR